MKNCFKQDSRQCNSKKANYFLALLITCLSISASQKLLAHNFFQEPNNQASTKINPQNQYLNKIESWSEIIRQNKEQLSLEEIALIKSKIANSYFQIGRYEKAIQNWRYTLEFYRSNQQNQHLSATLNYLAQGYLSMGQTLLAERKLNEAIIIAKREKLDNILCSAYLTLSKIERIRGEYIKAEINSKYSLKYASSPREKTAVHQNFSQLFYDRVRELRLRAKNIATDTQSLNSQTIGYLDRAWFHANRAIESRYNIESLVAVDAYLQLLQVGSEVKNFNPNPYLNKAETILSKLSNSTRKVYALINLSEFQQNPLPTLRQATEIAEHLEDNRAASFALGHLGKYYEQKKQYTEALDWTNRATQAASQAQAHKSLYQWHWQKGRIYNTLGQNQLAITAYYQAISSLQAIRTELARSNHIDFRLEIEPVYRELLQLLLSSPTSARIEQALKIRDLLQLSELENFFKDDCLTLLSEQDDLLPSTTGLIYTLVLPEATYVIFKQGKQSTSVKIDITQSQWETLVNQWRYSLEDRSEENYLSLSKKMYNLLIESIKSELALNQPDTLIFINDGILKNVPMTALYDGQKFLVEDYAVSVSLSLNLQVRKNQPLSNTSQILAFGLSKETKNFSALPYVQREIQSISDLVAVKQILNAEFSVNTVEQELIENNYPIVHFATHGKFNGTLEESFLETYQGRISLIDLVSILNQHQLNFPHNPLNLLVLSACETAASNERATLGMAGIAIRAGVSNAVGSLWSVNDRSEVYLIEKFYQGLIKEGMSPEQALHQAQIKMIGEGFHPSIWSNLILISS